VTGPRKRIQSNQLTLEDEIRDLLRDRRRFLRKLPLNRPRPLESSPAALKKWKKAHTDLDAINKRLNSLSWHPLLFNQKFDGDMTMNRIKNDDEFRRTQIWIAKLKAAVSELRDKPMDKENAKDRALDLKERSRTISEMTRACEDYYIDRYVRGNN